MMAATTALQELWQRECRRLETTLNAVFPQRPPQPAWATEHEVDPLNSTVTLRLFGDRESQQAPVLVVTPQVNHSYIADYAPDQSLVRTLLEAGVGRVAVVDWAPPTGDPYGIDESIEDVEDAIARLGGRVHLVGLCQGGWQAVIVAARSPELVASLTIAAAPVDTHVGNTPLHAFTMGLPMAFFEGLVAANGGTAPGRALATGFDLLRPFERFVYNYLSLYFNADDPAYVDRYQRLRNWYRLNKDLAGNIYLEAVGKLFKENRLARGELTVRGERVDLSRIACPVHLVAGSRDHITPADQVFALEPLAPNAVCHRHLVEAGHIGVFMGRHALATVWRELAGVLATEPLPWAG